jgi:IS30 family transposase
MAVTALSNQSTQHIESWQSSGLSQAAYCRQHGIHPNTFSSWLRFCKNQAPAPIALIPVQVEATHQVQQAPSLLVLQHASGHRLELPATQSAQWVAQLWQCLG